MMSYSENVHGHANSPFLLLVLDIMVLGVMITIIIHVQKSNVGTQLLVRQTFVTSVLASLGIFIPLS